MLTKDQLTTVSTQPKKITSPTLGDVYVRLISEEEAITSGKIQGAESRAKFLSYALCDEDGARLYADGDLAEIRKLPFKDVWYIFEQGMMHNGMMPTEEPEKN